MTDSSRPDVFSKPGVLPFQRLVEAIDNGWIAAGHFNGFRPQIEVDDIQPASIDLRLGAEAWPLEYSFVPAKGELVADKLPEVAFDKAIDLTQGAILECNRAYLIPLVEELHLPSYIKGKANPKSSTGRVDVFTRIITDGSHRFDEIAAGYSGRLYLEVVPRSFPVYVKSSLALNQLRLAVADGAEVCSDAEIRDLHQASPLLYRDGSPVPSDDLALSDGLFLSVDVSQPSPGSDRIVALKARDATPPLDLTISGRYDWRDYWEPVEPRKNGSIILKNEAFYLLLSSEAVCVPPTHAAEMMAYDPTAGELRTHYAGFFDPGFGYDPKRQFFGSRAALEVRARDVSFMVEDRQPICKLSFERVLEMPTVLYGEDVSSNYQGQTVMLSKHFARQTASATQMRMRDIDSVAAFVDSK